MSDKNEIVIEFVECDMEEANAFINNKPFKAVVKNGS